MNKNSKIIVSLPDEKPFEAFYISDSFNDNLIKIQIGIDYPRYGFVNKKYVESIKD